MMDAFSAMLEARDPAFSHRIHPAPSGVSSAPVFLCAHRLACRYHLGDVSGVVVVVGRVGQFASATGAREISGLPSRSRDGFAW
jgi:hypothetical protein